MENVQAQKEFQMATAAWPKRGNQRRLPGLAQARNNAALSVRELAGLSGVHYVTISELERGKRAAHPSTVRKLANALGVRPVDLYTPPEEADEE
jgi:transcriptional regulator with XRE-family HTH domain